MEKKVKLLVTEKGKGRIAVTQAFSGKNSFGPPIGFGELKRDGARFVLRKRRRRRQKVRIVAMSDGKWRRWDYGTMA